MGSYYFTLLCVCILPFIALALLIFTESFSNLQTATNEENTAVNQRNKFMQCQI